MSPESDEDMAQLKLGVEFLRLGAWNDFSSVSPPLLGKRPMLNLHTPSRDQAEVHREAYTVFLHVLFKLKTRICIGARVLLSIVSACYGTNAFRAAEKISSDFACFPVLL